MAGEGQNKEAGQPAEDKDLEGRIKSVKGLNAQQIADFLTIFRMQRTAINKDVTRIVQTGEASFQKGVTEARQYLEKGVEIRQQKDPSLKQTFDNAKDMASVVIQKAVAVAAKEEIDKGKDELREYTQEQKREAVLEAKKEIRDILKGQILRGFKRSRNYIIAAGIIAVVVGAASGLYSLRVSYTTKTKDVVDVDKKVDAEGKAREKLETKIGENEISIAKWQGTHDTTKKKEDDARAKATGDLETKLTGEIAKKADKTYLDVKIAESNKQYTDLKIAFDAEVAKNPAKEEARAKLVARGEETREVVDKLVTQCNTFATRDYTDKEAGILREHVDKEVIPKIKEYGVTILQLLKTSSENTEEAKKLREAYNGVVNLSKAVELRVKKIEEENKNYQPPTRDR
jgi:hypothetical protein